MNLKQNLLHSLAIGIFLTRFICSSQENMISPKEEMPPELIKKILVKKIKDKVEDIGKQNQDLFDKITKKKSFIDSLKFKLLRKFNHYQELKQKKAQLDSLKTQKEAQEALWGSLQQDLQQYQADWDSQNKSRKNQSELGKASQEGIEEIDLIKKHIKRLFVFQLVALKKHNQGLIRDFTSLKQDRDRQLKEVNKGLHYLRQKVDTMRKDVRSSRFDSELEENNWRSQVADLLEGCEPMQPLQDEELQGLDALNRSNQ